MREFVDEQIPESCRRRWQAERKIYEAGPEKVAVYARTNPACLARILVIVLTFRDSEWLEKFIEKYTEPD